jgi:hypothetical protein
VLVSSSGNLANHCSGPELNGGARLQAAAKQVADDVAVGAADDPVLLNEGVRSLAGTLGEPVVELHRQPERLAERLDRLHTTGEGTRNDPSHLGLIEEPDKLGSLAATVCVQGTKPVVAVPIVTLTGGRVADENTRHVETIRLADELRELLPRPNCLPLEAWRRRARSLEQK